MNPMAVGAEYNALFYLFPNILVGEIVPLSSLCVFTFIHHVLPLGLGVYVVKVESYGSNLSALNASRL